MQTKIFDAKASNVEESEQNKYIKELEDEIKSVEKMDMKYLIFGLAKFILWAIVIILIRDTLGETLKENIKRKLPRKKLQL